MCARSHRKSCGHHQPTTRLCPDVDALRSELGMNARCALGRVQAAMTLHYPSAKLTIYKRQRRRLYIRLNIQPSGLTVCWGAALPRDDSFPVRTDVRNLALPFNRIILKPRKLKGNVNKSTQREHK